MVLKRGLLPLTKTRSEDSLILNGLTPGITKMGPVYKALNNFFEIKKSIDQSSRFNIILFQEDGPNYLEQFTLNPEHVLIALKSLEPTIVRANIGGGIFVAVSFIIDVFKKITEKTFRLIILTDKGSPKIAPIYMAVLENLIEQVKDMPFFIDIIRFNIDDPDEDRKLMRLAQKCNGGIHEINKIDLLSDILEFLALKREIDERNLIEGKNYRIPQGNQLFYENLAELPIESNKAEKCSICFLKTDKPVAACPNCKTDAHKTCWAKWAKRSNIGIPNVFRCFQCFGLIKLEKEFLKLVEYTEVLSSKDVNVEFLDVQEYLKSLETKGKPEIVRADEMLGLPSEVSENARFEEENIDDGKVELSENEVKFILCPYCFKMITNQYKRCPNCHRNLI